MVADARGKSFHADRSTNGPEETQSSAPSYARSAMDKRIESTAGQQQIHVLTVDPYPMFQHGIRHLLVQEHDLCPAGEASTVDEAVSVLRTEPVDVALLSTSASGEGIAGDVGILIKTPAKPQVLVLGEGEEAFLDVMRAGACGYLPRNAPPSRILDAIRAAAKGECRISGRVLQRLLSQIGLGNGLTQAVGAMKTTPREAEILDLLAQGLTNKEIGRELALSPNTVRNHLQRIGERAGVRNRVQLALLAQTHGVG